MEKQSFTYTYSAEKKAEAKRILEQYTPAPKAEQPLLPLDELHKIDDRIRTKALITSLSLGIVGTLILGGGMSMVMVFTDTLIVPGILVGLVVMAVAFIAYPVDNRILKREREKNADRIQTLAAEVQNG
jgi:hypothetical protein